MRIFNFSAFVLCLPLLACNSTFALDYYSAGQGINDFVTFESGETDFRFCDINSDGFVDIVSVGDHGSPDDNQTGILVFFNDGNGNFDVGQYGEFGYGGIAAGDVNNDGVMDLGYGVHHNDGIGDFGDQMVEVVLGDNTGANWIPWDDGLSSQAEAENWYGKFATDLGDFNNDGLLDIVSNSFGNGTGLHTYINNGDGTWGENLDVGLGLNAEFYCRFADFNNDGNLDIVASLDGHSIYFGDGAGGWIESYGNLPPQPDFQSLWSPSVGDVDGDGADDLAFLSPEDRYPEIWRYSTVTEEWEDISDNLPDISFWRCQLADMNMDGLLDLVTANNDGYTVIVHTNGIDGWEIEYSENMPDLRTWNAMEVGVDVDHNGYPDMVFLENYQQGMMNDYNLISLRMESSTPESLWARFLRPKGHEVYRAGSARFIDWGAALTGDLPGTVDIYFSIQGYDGPWVAIVEGYPNSGRYQWEIPAVVSAACVLKIVVNDGNDAVTVFTPSFFTILDGTPEFDANLTGIIYDSVTGDPIPGATVRSYIFSDVTDGSGTYSIDGLFSGLNGVSVTAPGYDTANEAVILVPGMNALDILTTGDYNVTIAPIGSVTIPPSGGVIRYGAELVNPTPFTSQMTAWTWVDLPNGNAYGPLLQTPINLSPGTWLYYPLNLQVPGMAPGGQYNFWAAIGVFPNQSYSQDSFQFFKVGGLAAGGEWADTPWESELAGLADDIVLPAAFIIASAYPNPFNPTTTISVSLPQPAELNVSVFNVNGQHVATLANGRFAADQHQFTFDASNMASGLYFVRATVPGQIDQIQKVMLVR